MDSTNWVETGESSEDEEEEEKPAKKIE